MDQTNQEFTPSEFYRQFNNSKQAIASVNVFGFEEARAIIEAAQICDTPLILAISEDFLKFSGILAFPALLRSYAKKAKVPVGLHLDHCRSMDLLRNSLAAGFDSIMYDGSAHPYLVNVNQTAQMAELCHSHGIIVEAELGVVPYAQGRPENVAELTDAEDARDFVAKTGVDILAVSVGNIQRLPNGTAAIDLPRLEEINHKVNRTLCLHGASGITPADIRASMKLGVRKYNFSSYLRKTWNKSMGDNLARNGIQADRMEMYYETFSEIVDATCQTLSLLMD